MSEELKVLKSLANNGGRSFMPAYTKEGLAALCRIEKKGRVKRVFGGVKTLCEGASCGNAWWELTVTGREALGQKQYNVTVHFQTETRCNSKLFEGVWASSEDEAIKISHDRLRRQNRYVMKVDGGEIEEVRLPCSAVG